MRSDLELSGFVLRLLDDDADGGATQVEMVDYFAHRAAKFEAAFDSRLPHGQQQGAWMCGTEMHGVVRDLGFSLFWKIVAGVGVDLESWIVAAGDLEADAVVGVEYPTDAPEVDSEFDYLIRGGQERGGFLETVAEFHALDVVENENLAVVARRIDVDEFGHEIGVGRVR